MAQCLRKAGSPIRCPSKATSLGEKAGEDGARWVDGVVVGLDPRSVSADQV